MVAYLALLGIGAVAVPLNPTSPASRTGPPDRTPSGPSPPSSTAPGRPPGGTSTAHRSRRMRTVIAADTAEIPGAVAAAEMMAAEPAPVVDVDRRSPRCPAVHERHGRRPEGGDAHPRQHARQPRPGAIGPRAPRTRRRRLRRDPAVPRVRAQRRPRPDPAVRGDAAARAALRPGDGDRVDPPNAASPCCSVRRRCGWRSASSRRRRPTPSPSIRVASSGAAKLPVTVAESLERRFGLVVAEGYGLTEASPVVTSSTGLTPRYGSVGAVLDGIDLRIVDEDGDDVLVGDAGELWVRGPNVFAGYLDDPEATERVLTADGWLRTGDIGYCDEDGFVYLVDRAKDLIIVSGFNVFPAEVEEVLLSHPGVAEAGVVGVPAPAHRRGGQGLRRRRRRRRHRRGDADRLRPRPTRPLQVPEQGRDRRRAPAQRRRQAAAPLPRRRPAADRPECSGHRRHEPRSGRKHSAGRNTRAGL